MKIRDKFFDKIRFDAESYNEPIYIRINNSSLHMIITTISRRK